jgi:hypothetical protein
LVVYVPTLRAAVDTPDVEVEVEVEALFVLDVEVEVEVETPTLKPDAAAWACGGEVAAEPRGGGTANATVGCGFSGSVNCAGLKNKC